MSVAFSHYIPPRNFAEVEKEFVEPVPADYFIWWVFRRRCVMCSKPSTEINEIVPRGRSKKSLLDWKNRVTLCRTCHDEFHYNGVTDAKIKDMQERRIQALKRLGREEYLNGDK